MHNGSLYKYVLPQAGAFSELLGVSLVIFVFSLLQMFGFSELSSHRADFNPGLKNQYKKKKKKEEAAAESEHFFFLQK